MESAERRYSKEEFSRRGDTIYDNDVRPQLSTDDEGKFAAIDIDSGAYEVDVDELAACDRLRARVPDAQIWMVRIGSRYVHRGLLSGYELRIQVRPRGKVTITVLP